MSGEINKNWKSMVCAGIVTLLLAGGVRESRAESHQNYFPLNVGNSWTYVDYNDGSTKTFTIIGTEEINGHRYYKFDDYWGEVREGEEYLFRYEANRILMWDSWWYNRHGEEVVRYDFTGGDYWDGGIYGICRLKRGDVSCNVPAGEFSDCINFQFLGMDCGPDCYGYGEYMAPNVGNVKYVEPGGECYGCEEKEGDTVTFELQSYTIVPYCGDPDHPYPVGDLNHDCRVNLLDLAILAAHWLECTVPECDLAVSESDITFSNPNPASGEEVTMTVTVHNIGGVDAGEFVVYISLSCSLDGIIWTIPMPWDWITVPHLPAWSSTTISKENVSFLGGMSAIMVWVDWGNQIDESNEQNNWTGKVIEIQP